MSAESTSLAAVPPSMVSRALPAARWVRAAVLWGGFAVVVLFGVLFLIRDSLKYLEWTEVVYQRFWPQRWMLAGHVLTASLCLLVAPLQFSARLRGRWPKFHRAVGWTYVIGALMSAVLTLRLGFFSACRMCIPPFAIWSFLFLIVTVLAVWFAVRRRLDLHRQFMIRSWVLLNGFVVVRLDAHLGFPFPSGPEISRPAMLIWAAWVVPFLVTEMWLTWLPLVIRSRGPLRRRAAA